MYYNHSSQTIKRGDLRKLFFKCLCNWLCYSRQNYQIFSLASLLSPVNNVEGGYRNSQRPSVCPSVRKESPLTATIFHRSLPNFYTMFIPLKTFIICSFIKKCQKLLPWQPFFFFTFQAYLPMFVPYLKA